MFDRRNRVPVNHRSGVNRLTGLTASGAPISRVPGEDNADLAKDPLSNNDFLFTIDTPPPSFCPATVRE